MALDAEAKAVVLDLVVPFRLRRDDGRSGWDAEQGLKHAAKIGISRPLPSTRFQSDGIGGERFKSLPGTHSDYRLRAIITPSRKAIASD
jgi:hypothetical protein